MLMPIESLGGGAGESHARFFLEKEPRHKLWAVWASLITALAWVLCFPPFEFAEFAYAFAVPVIYWAYLRPPFRLFAFSVLSASIFAWIGILWWLHHVSWIGLPLLGGVMGLWSGLWFLLLWWVMPRIAGQSLWLRLLAMFALAGAWVLLEWTRTWVLSGFPWLPLAASQWQRLAILQIASYTGAGGISFVLISMNIGLAAYAHRLLKEKKRGLAKRSQEFFMALFLLVICLSVFFTDTIRRGHFVVPLGRAGIVQPNIPQSVKWDPAQGPGILSTLERESRRVARFRPDLILWPEAATPWALKGHAGMQGWVESLVRDLKTPLLAGAIAIEKHSGGMEDWYNSVFYISPEEGVGADYYSKRHLVPFGEYVPMRPLLGWVSKVSDAGEGDFARGKNAETLILDSMQIETPQGKRSLRAGILICYEDIFPSLARESVKKGADILIVQTNNAWFGEEGMAYQHAAHSVLRAVETRRPILRAGNAGWSGWIDEFGEIRGVLTRDADGRVSTAFSKEKAGNIYFCGGAAFDISLDRRWIGQDSFYVRHGEYFTGICAVLLLSGMLILRRVRLAKKTELSDNTKL